MRVMCIADGRYWADKHSGKKFEGPDYLDTCIVTGTVNDQDFGLCYKLEGYDQENQYVAKWFIPLSDDESDTNHIEFKDLQEEAQAASLAASG